MNSTRDSNLNTSHSNVSSEELFEFKRALLKILSKLGNNHTVAIAWDEIRRFMANDITDHEHMIMFLNMIAESNDHMKPLQRKETLRIFGVAAEIFEDALFPYLTKILGTFCRKSTEPHVDTHPVISETLGTVVLHLIEKGESYEAQLDLLN